MTYRGRVENGVIVLDEAPLLPEGAAVKVEIDSVNESRKVDEKPRGVPALMKYAGCITDLPPDASVNLDHYLYGHPKRE